VSRRRSREETVAACAVFLWDHLGREEGVILPAAQRLLLAEDPAASDQAFAANRDSNGNGAYRECRQLFAGIVDLTPARLDSRCRRRHVGASPVWLECIDRG
jgi:hypothetical protein